MARLELKHAGAFGAIGRFEDIHLVTFRARIDAESVDLAVRDFEALAQRHPDKRLGTILVIEPNIPLPDPDIRHVTSRQLTRIQTLSPYRAAVILGDGFWLSAARSVLTAIQLATLRTAPIHTSESVDAAAKWVCERTSRPLTHIPAILGAVDELRQAGREDRASVAQVR